MRTPRPMTALVTALAVGALLAASGCATSEEQTGRAFDGSDDEVLLTVENNDFADANIHVLWNGVRTRAGMVVGKTSETFRLPWRSEWAQIEVDFVGPREDYHSERFSVDPGDHLNFVIMVGLSER